ncbi:MAG: methyl-accepting chemotaxis protein, partial [Methyloceanibacter sp.]
VLTGTIAQGSVLLDKTLNDRIGHFNAMVDQRALLLDKQLVDRTNTFATALDQRAGALDKALHDRTTQFATAINQGATSLDKTLSERAESFTTSLFQRVRSLEQAITQQTGSLDKTMTERAQAVIMALAERLQAIDTTFNQRTSETERMLGEHARSTQDAFAKQTAQLNQVLANNSAMMQQTANQVGAQSKEAVGVLTSQTQTLREVSRGLLDQIHGLTQRFENQGQAILTAAKALDSSNTKIDSILEGRHQAIIALLHTVNTKAQDLDNMMRSYAGMMENTLSQAEHRAKQVGTALARDTAGQAQAALNQIERLREEAQSHTNRAVTDLKGSFEQIITQIGRQLEQMRGQFDTTSRGMHEVAQKTATDLDGLRQEMQKRMETLPEQTAQTTAAIRKALDQQVKEIEAITPALTRAAAQAAVQAAPAPMPAAPMPTAPMQGGGGDPFRRGGQGQAPSAGFDLPPVGRPAGFTPATATGQYDMPPMPKFDVRGRQVASGEGGDMDQVTNSLAQQLGGTSYSPQGGGARGGNFGMSDMPEPGYGAGQSFANRGVQQAASPLGGGNQLRLDELARAIDQRTASDVWYRFRSGDRGALGRHIYSLDGQATFDEIARRYDRDADFRVTVDRYIGDFERLLGEAEASDPDGRMLQNYLVSETGRVYLLLAHASGRLR